MSAPDHARVKELFLAVIARPQGERAAAIERDCDGDPALRAEVESLLAHHRDDDPLIEEPPPDRTGATWNVSDPSLAHGPTRLGHGRAQAAAPATAAALPAGTRIGSYEIIRTLGRGGMGRVYLARDVKLGRRVAMKFLIDPVPGLAERFLVEARATARCQHENIVVIHEVNEHQGDPFMVLEYLEGNTLARELAAGPQPPARALELIIPVVRALRHAHELGIVHRDLKPENILLTDAGVVKVLDFGIARAFEGDAWQPDGAAADPDRSTRLTQAGAVVGTPPYMAPEQLRAAPIDARVDIWAAGIVLHELVTGRHPLADDLVRAVRWHSEHLDQPMPSAALSGPDLPPDLVAVIDRCLAKAPAARYASAAELLTALEALLPERRGQKLAEDQCPYPGLSAFGEDEADRFFGRSADVRRAIARLADRPLVAILGPSGAGKSSFVRAGLAPALRRSAEPWEILGTRPGRDPMAGLLELARAPADDGGDGIWIDVTTDRLRAEPGYLGAMLRQRARRTHRSIVLHVDQFEELYTLVAAPEDRLSYTACLAAIADDVAAPVRVVLTMRSDFLDRVSEDAALMSLVTDGLMFLAPLDRADLREALTRPAALANHAFESDTLVEDMIDALESAAGALPLLQFAAAKLWDGRDRGSRRLTAASYRAMGGIAGAIAAHADQVVADLAPAAQREARSIFLRLVTPDRTRALVDLKDLVPEQRKLVDDLVHARLLVVTNETVEIVHESLISTWPLLARWLDEEKEAIAFHSQLRTAAKQWDERGRPRGMLWRNEAIEDARRRRQRLSDVVLSPRERDFLDAAFGEDDRARRTRRRVLGGAFALLAAITAAALVAMFWIRGAERKAREHAERARDEANRALQARQRADAESARAESERESREAAEKQARQASERVEETQEDLRVANERLRAALALQELATARARAAQTGAEREAERARAAEAEVRTKQRELEILLGEKEDRVRKLEAQMKKISTDLK